MKTFNANDAISDDGATPSLSDCLLFTQKADIVAAAAAALVE